MINILVSGDYSPQNRVLNLIEEGKYEAIFGEIRALNSTADYSIINFESTVADETDIPIHKHGPNLRCTSRALEALKWSGFDMVTVANNHFYDYGQISLEKSFEAIKKYGLDYVGGGFNLSEAKNTFYKQIKGKCFAFINCCEHEFSIATSDKGGSNPLNPIQQYYAIVEAKQKADFVIVIVHGGPENFSLPTQRMKETYRFFIDAGADTVINHHQHCYSGFEYYKEKPIIYGLGNLCFDKGTVNMPWNEGYISELSFDDSDIRLTLHPYVQCAQTPEIKFLENREKFESQINKLNQIIKDDVNLELAAEDYYQDSANSYLSTFEPYNNRYMLYAWSHHIIPSSFRGRRIDKVQNILSCESHLDRLKYIVSQRFNAHALKK